MISQYKRLLCRVPGRYWKLTSYLLLIFTAVMCLVYNPYATVNRRLRSRFYFSFEPFVVSYENYNSETDSDYKTREMTMTSNFGKLERTSTFVLHSNRWRSFFNNKRPSMEGVECHKVFAGDDIQTVKAARLIDKELPSTFYVENTINCSSFIDQMGYITDTLSMEEEDFPIAFSLLMYQSVEQAERLLRSIYRPQNIYCIHVDLYSDPVIHQAMEGIASCFPNVIMASRSIAVDWGEFSVLEPDLVCMQDLLKLNKKWRYFINLTGQEFPLKTNYELVKILKAYNGANDVSATIKRADPTRWEDAGPPPHNLTAVKGAVHVVVNRDFVTYLLSNQTGLDLLEWAKKTLVPDETVFATLNGNPQLGLRGTYIGEQETTTNNTKPYLARLKNWGNSAYNWTCHGRRSRGVCVLGVGDLPLLASAPHMFANKFYRNFQPAALACMEQLIFNRTRDEFFKTSRFNATFYSQLGFVKHMVH